MIEQCTVNQAKIDFYDGVHQPDDDYYIALFVDGADLGPDTKRYSSKNEARGEGYSAGGMKLYGRKTWWDGAARMTWDNPEWPNVTLRNVVGALIYNASKDNAAIHVLDFGQGYSATVGPFRIKLPDGGVIINR